MGRATLPVGHREDRVRRLQAVGNHRERESEHQAEEQIGRVELTEVKLGEAERREERPARPLRQLPRAARDDQRVRDPHQRPAEGDQRPRGEGRSAPAPEDRDPEGPRAAGELREVAREPHRDERDADEHHQVPPSPDDEQGEDRAPTQDAGDERRREDVHAPHYRGEPGGSHAGEPANERILATLERVPDLEPGEHDDEDREDRHHHDPEAAAPAKGPGERRRLTRRPAPTPRLVDAGDGGAVRLRFGGG